MKGFFSIIRNEFRSIFRDEGAMLILIGALVIYSALYGFIYKPEVVVKMPVAVVDQDDTPSSRSLTSKMSATKQLDIYAHAPTLEEAKRLFYNQQVLGVIYIPEGYEKQSLNGEQANVSLYADGSYFLLYSSLLNAGANVIIETGNQLQVERFMKMGLEKTQAVNLSQPLQYKVETLHNPYGGYATALLPSVLIVILQQVILIGIGMVMGSDNEFKRWKPLEKYSAIQITLGKLIAYVILYAPLIVYLLWVNYKFFGYPMNGNTSDEVLFLLPYLLSCIFAGIALGGIWRRRESSLMYLAVFSVFFIMISGISWPREGMSPVLYYIGKVLPSSSGIEGWVSLRTSGNTLSDVAPQFAMLWFLTAVYGIMAIWSVGYARKRNA